jgi:hypothetical protein
MMSLAGVVLPRGTGAPGAEIVQSRETVALRTAIQDKLSRRATACKTQWQRWRLRQ